LKKILGEKLFDIAISKKSVRNGKGKMRGRKYKKTAGLLLVTGENESIKTKSVETKNVQNLSVTDLAKGSPGRLVLYTEAAIKFLEVLK
jgi:large subunit ribosomal protein L4e